MIPSSSNIHTSLHEGSNEPEDLMMMDQAVFWSNWASFFSAPSLRARVGKILLRESTHDEELASSLHLAGMHTAWASASWPGLWPPAWPYFGPQVGTTPGEDAANGDNTLALARLVEAAQNAADSISAANVRLAASELDRAKQLMDAVATATQEDIAVERAAAYALALVDSAVQQFGVDVKQAQKDTQDVLILACSLSLGTDELREQGIPDRLREKLCAAAQQDITADSYLWSRLGNSKFQLFTKGMKFDDRPRRQRSLSPVRSR